MRILFALLVAGSAVANRSYNDWSARDFLRPATMPDDLADQLVFWAPLEFNQMAHGAGAPGLGTFTRATAATYVGRNGLLVRAGSGVPRFELDGYLVEDARTNLALYSEDFSQAAVWVAVNITPTYDQVGPDGAAGTASRLTADAGNGVILQTIVSASAARVTSCWIKRVTGTGNVDITQDNGTSWKTILTSETGWIPVTSFQATATNPIVGIRIVDSGDAVDISMFQHELGTFPSSAIPTAAASATRNRDQLFWSAAGSGLVASRPATIATMVDVSNTAITGTASTVYGNRSGTGGFGIYGNGTGSTNVVTNIVQSGGGTVANIIAASEVYTQTPKMIVQAIATNDFQLYARGVSLGVDVAGAAPNAYGALQLYNEGGSAAWYGHLCSLTIFRSRLPTNDVNRLRSCTL